MEPADAIWAWQAARAAAVTFVMYLRPSESSGLSRPCLTPPSQIGASTARMWTVKLHPEEAGTQTKTRELECSLLVDNPDFLYIPALLAFLTQKESERVIPLGAHRRIFLLTHCEWSAQYAEAFQLLGLQNFGPQCLLPIPARGGQPRSRIRVERPPHIDEERLLVDATVRPNVRKGERLAEVLTRLTVREAAFAEACHPHIGTILCGTCPRMPPSTAQLPSRSSRTRAGGRRLGVTTLVCHTAPLSSRIIYYHVKCDGRYVAGYGPD